jgi:hypothetical protein
MSRRLAVAAMLAAAPFAAAGAEEITVYPAIEADQLKGYEAAFEAANPSVDIRWVRDSTGIVTAKLLAEKANPRADVVFGLAATSLMLLQKEGMLDAQRNVVQAEVTGLEFVGNHIAAILQAPGTSFRVAADLSLNDVRDLRIERGRPLPIALPPERLHVFPDIQAAA